MWGRCWLRLRDAVINVLSSRGAETSHRPPLEKASAFLEKYPFIVVVTEWHRSVNLWSIPHLLWAKTRIVTMVTKKMAASLQRFRTPRKFCGKKEAEYQYMKQTNLLLRLLFWNWNLTSSSRRLLNCILDTRGASCTEQNMLHVNFLCSLETNDENQDECTSAGAAPSSSSCAEVDVFTVSVEDRKRHPWSKSQVQFKSLKKEKETEN